MQSKGLYLRIADRITKDILLPFNPNQNQALFRFFSY